jgi:hypothetical protein
MIGANQKSRGFNLPESSRIGAKTFECAAVADLQGAMCDA